MRKCLQNDATLKPSWLILLEMINTLPQRFWLVITFFTLISFASFLPLPFSYRLNLFRRKGLACVGYAGQNCYTRIQPMRRTSERERNKAG